MKELDLQKRTIDVIEARGGFGLKMSNQFLIGVPDLYLKPLGVQHCILEAKLKRGYYQDPDHPFDPGCTGPQRSYLKRMRAAGTLTGVLSFVCDKKNRNFSVCVSLNYKGPLTDRMHVSIDGPGNVKIDDDLLYEQVMEFIKTNS